jgi:uncharacterized surface protein with fasciclin (FAS1) repeats
MKTIKKISVIVLMFMTITTVFAIDKNEIEKMPFFEIEEESKQTIVEVALNNENFTTLVAALKAANLVETLSSAGPFTVFAPVNAAFDKLPEGVVDDLLKPENKEILTSILTYHVVVGELKAVDLVAAISANNGSFAITTVQGGVLIATLNDGKVILTDEKGKISTVIIADVDASNGIIHAIDTIVTP